MMTIILILLLVAMIRTIQPGQPFVYETTMLAEPFPEV